MASSTRRFIQKSTLTLLTVGIFPRWSGLSVRRLSAACHNAEASGTASMRPLYWLALLSLVAIPPAWAADKGEVRIAAVKDDADTEHTFEVVMREAYRRIGLPVRVEYLPALRGLAEANSGQADALLARLPVIEKDYPNVRRVPTSIGQMTFLAVTHKPSLRVRSWEDLRPLNIGIRRGYKIAEIKTAGMKVNLVDNYASMFQMLVLNRLDVLVIREPGLGATLQSLQAAGTLTGAETFHSTVLEYVPAFHYLHANRADLIAPLDDALKAMTKEGFMKRLQADEADKR